MRPGSYAVPSKANITPPREPEQGPPPPRPRARPRRRAPTTRSAPRRRRCLLCRVLLVACCVNLLAVVKILPCAGASRNIAGRCGRLRRDSRRIARACERPRRSSRRWLRRLNRRCGRWRPNPRASLSLRLGTASRSRSWRASSPHRKRRARLRNNRYYHSLDGHPQISHRLRRPRLHLLELPAHRAMPQFVVQHELAGRAPLRRVDGALHGQH